MDDETSSRYIFFLMLLLMSFLVIGLSIKALIINNVTKHLTVNDQTLVF